MSDVSSPRVALIDLDGTLYRWSLYVELVEQLMRFQQNLPAYFFESQAQRKTWEERSLHDDAYLSQVIHDWEARSIMGLSENELVLAVREVLRKQKSRSYIFTREMVAVLKERGYHLIAIGGSPKPMIQALAKEWNIDEAYGAEYVVDTLRVYSRNQAQAKQMDQRKADVVRAALKDGLLDDGSIALGDAGGDWTILKQVTHPIAFNPDQALYLKARQAGIPVVWERKNVVCAYQTYPEQLGVREDAFLFHEVPWSKILPLDVAELLTKRLRALDQTSTAG